MMTNNLNIFITQISFILNKNFKQEQDSTQLFVKRIHYRAFPILSF